MYTLREAIFCQLIFIYVIANPESVDVMMADMHLSKVFEALLTQVS
jgi:hypothetical protein